MATVGDESAAHVQAKLTTKLKQFKVQDAPFSLPASTKSVELNLLLTSLLFGEDNEEKTQDFIFLVGGEFLGTQTTLNDIIESNNLSTESVIEIEYIIKEDEPELSQTLHHDDWISAIDINLNDLILTSSFDNTLSIWNLKGELMFNIEAHSMAVKDTCWIDNNTFLSASQDQTIRIWKVNDNKKKPPVCTSIGRGHAASVDSLSVSPSKHKFATGSWDKMIKIWEANPAHEDVEEEENSKKKKTNDPEQSPATQTPLVTLSGHKEPVSDVLWKSDEQLISVGWDHCIRFWDVNTGLNLQTLTANKVVLTCDYSTNNDLVVTGSVDKFMRFYDSRTTDGTVLKFTLPSLNGWISDVQWSSVNENQVMSGSYDTMVALWDIRNTKSALSDLQRHTDRVMCVNCSKPGYYMSGGADCLVHISSVKKNKHGVSEE